MPSSDAIPAEDLADLYENAPCGYVSLSPDARVVKINRTLTTWLGSASADLVGKPFHDLLTFGGRIAYETHLAPLLRLQGHVDEITFDLIRSDGAKIPVIANAAEKRDLDGRHLLTRLTLFKAVDRRTYERGLIEDRDRAEAAFGAEHETAALREQFIAVLGHDLRNPLAALSAGVRMLSQRETLSERGRVVVKDMSASIARATALIANLLDFAQGRLGGGLSLTLSADQPLGPVLEQVVAESRAITPDREILTSFAIAEPVCCDAGRIAQLAANLVSNAVTHGAPGVPIEVEAKTDRGRFTLSVINGGVAIPPEARAQLFQPFFRGAVRRSQQGLGLGLFIVNEIAKAHGGAMTVVSTDEQTVFTFAMPTAGRSPP
ncbi:MAG TPA: PAS domain-containing sensor histidine kinase [Sphingomicrobium sp.]